MKRSLPFAALLLGTLLCTGCVSTATHQKTVDEAAALATALATSKTELQALAAREETCTGELSKTQRRLEEAQRQFEEKQAALERAQTDIVRLEKVLSERNQEVGRTMTQMRQELDRLKTEEAELRSREQAAEQTIGELRRELDRLRAETEQAAELRRQQEEEGQRLSAEKGQLLQERDRLAREKAAREEELRTAQATYGELLDKMRSEIARGEITISDLKGKLTVNMVEKILFDSGSAELKSGGKELLRKVGAILAGVRDQEIRVEGHTDNLPISPRLQSLYPSNWELSAARAISVVQFLRNSVGLPGERLSASGFGEYRPIADNATSEGRAQNRRIQIILAPPEHAAPQ